MKRTKKKDQRRDPLPEYVLAAWRTNCRITERFLRALPSPLWELTIPGSGKKTVRMIAGHIHNSRCMWVKMVGRKYGVRSPGKVDRRKVKKPALIKALRDSGDAVAELLLKGIAREGVLTISVPWSNIPSDAVHFSAYLIAHEAHHRGQIVLTARASGHRLSPHITTGLWQWKA